MDRLASNTQERSKIQTVARRKSCSECAKAKRRCDLQQPLCSRCVQQNLTCRYPAGALTPSPARRSDESASTTPANETAQWPLYCSLLSNESNSLYSGLSSKQMDMTKSSTCTKEPGNFGVVPTIHDLSETNLTSNGFFPPLSFSLPLCTLGPLTPQPAQALDFSMSNLSALAISRLPYAIDQLKLAPSMLVEENKTFWMHSKLYDHDAPRYFQDAHAACALHISSNAVNSAFISRHIENRVNELLEITQSDNPLELLSMAHALLLYLIIQAFSGDMRAHAQVLVALPHLEKYASELNKLHVDDIVTIPHTSARLAIYPTIAAYAVWRSWIFCESLHRTTLIISLLVGTIRLLQGDENYCHLHQMLGSKVDVSAYLWQASSVFDFAMAWNEEHHLEVRDMDCTKLVAEAKPTDVDMFGRMMLALWMGVDDTRGWFHSNGCIF